MIAQTHMEYIKFIGPSELRNEYLYHVWSETDEQFQPFRCDNLICCDIACDIHFESESIEGKPSKVLKPLLQLCHVWIYSIPQEICTRFLLCCALLWLYIDWFSHIHQANFTGTVAI